MNVLPGHFGLLAWDDSDREPDPSFWYKLAYRSITGYGWANLVTDVNKGHRRWLNPDTPSLSSLVAERRRNRLFMRGIRRTITNLRSN